MFHIIYGRLHILETMQTICEIVASAKMSSSSYFTPTLNTHLAFGIMSSLPSYQIHFTSEYP